MSNKRYYWLKLKEDFFEQDEIKVVESMENGKDYIIFYLKLVLKSINTGGELRFKKAIPYDDKMLSTITGTNIDVVRSAIKLFSQLGMIEVWDDGTLYMLATEAMIGSESSSARRVRRHRERKAIEQKEEPKALQCNGNETKSNTDIDTDKDKDKERDTDKEEEEPPTQSVVESIRDKNSKPAIINQLLDAGLDKETAEEYWYFRATIKKDRPTSRAVQTLINECERSNIPLSVAVGVMIERGWKGFRAEWYLKEQRTAVPQMTRREQVEQHNAVVVDSIKEKIMRGEL